MSDIPEPRGDRAQLSDNDLWYRALFERSLDCVYVHDMDGVFLDANPAAIALLGYERELIPSLSLSSLLTEDQLPKALRTLAEIKETGTQKEVTEYRVQRKDGQLIDVETNGSLLVRDGTPMGVLGIARDITARKRAEERLRESEETARALLNASPDPAYLVDSEYRVLAANAPGIGMAGVQAGQLRGCSVVDILPPRLAQEIQRHFNEVIQAGQPTRFEHEELGRHLDISLHPASDAEGHVKRIAVHTSDITERRLAECALRESEERYKHFVQMSAEGIWRIDVVPPVDLTLPEREQARKILENARVKECNDESARLFGYRSADDMLGQPVAVLISGTEEDRLKRVLEFLQSGYRLVDVESAKRDCDGNTVWFLGSVIGTVQNDRLVTCWCTLRDITERKRIEERLRTGEEEYRQLFDLGSDALCIMENNTGRILEANTAAVNLYGYERDELLTMKNTDVSAEPEKTREATATGLTHVPLRWHVKRDGTRFPVEITARHFSWRGRPVHVAAIRDITERLRAQEERHHLEEQLQHAQKLEGVGRLAGGIAHDFNNLLTVINGYSDLVLKELHKDDPLCRPIGEIRNAGERAAILVDQLLTFSRKQLIEPKPIDLNSVLAEAERMLQRLAGEDIRFVTRFGASAGCVMADPGQIHQVLMNLTVNARDAMPNGGTLAIETANIDVDEQYAAAACPGMTPGAYILLTVTDTGAGMDAQTLPHIFEPFFTTKAKGVGTGLGLSTVYGIVRQGGGWIYVESEVGRGTTFRIYLPRIAVIATIPEPTVAARTPPRGSETVLVVEDQEQVRRLIVDALKSCGYRIVEAKDGDEALTEAGKYPDAIHLLLTDVVMPGMTGRELAARLRPLRPRMKVLYTSDMPRAPLSAGV